MRFQIIIKERPHKRYYLRYKIAGMKKSREVALKAQDGPVRTDTEAQAAANRIRALLMKGVDPFAQALTLRELESKYLKAIRPPIVAENSHAAIASRLSQFLTWMEAHHPTIVEAQAVTPAHLQAYHRHLMDRLAPSSVNNHIALLRGAFQWGVDWEDLPSDPTRRIRPLKVPRRTLALYQPGELDALREALPEPAKTAFEFCMETGVRPGEMMELTWQDWQIRDLTQRKTGEPRPVTVSPYLTDKINALPRTSDLVFTNSRGTPWNRASWRAALYRVQDDLGWIVFRNHKIESGTPRNPHMLRHQWVTDALAAGVDVRTIQYNAGWKTLAPLSIYAQVSGDMLEDAAEKVRARRADMDKKVDKKNEGTANPHE